MQKKKLFALISLTLVAQACSSVGLVNTPPSNLAVQNQNQTAEPLAGINFKPLSAISAKYLASQGTGNSIPTSLNSDNSTSYGSSVGSTVNIPVDLSSPAMPFGFSGNAYGYYCYGGYGFDREMSLISASEAETVGFKGSSFQELLKTVVTPVLKEWAKDGRLIRSDGDLAEDGTLGECGYNPSWRLSYVSTERNEEIDFVIGTEKTLIIRQRWAPLNLSPESVSMDSSSALKALKTLIENKEAKSEEEKTGLDYFLQTPFPSASPVPGNNCEVIYQLPPAMRWSVSLKSIVGHLVWDLNGYPTANANGPLMNESGFVMNNNARGMVDAQTGTVIRFSRPTKYFYTMPSPYATPIPVMPIPGPSATPIPSPGPTATPMPTAPVCIGGGIL